MLIDTNIIVIQVDLAKKVSLNGAVLLQRIHNLLAESPHERNGRKWLMVDLPLLNKRWFPFWSGAVLSRTYNKLVSDGYLNQVKNLFAGDNNVLYCTIEYRMVNLDTPKLKQAQPEQPDLFGNTQQKPKRKSNANYALSMKMMDLTQSDPRVVGKEQFFRSAKKLRAAGYTIDEISEWYGEGGWWYTDTPKGKIGKPPTLYDINNTVKQAKAAEHRGKGDFQLA